MVFILIRLKLNGCVLINVQGTSENVDFEVNGVTQENTGDSIKYLGVNLMMRK